MEFTELYNLRYSSMNHFKLKERGYYTIVNVDQVISLIIITELV